MSELNIQELEQKLEPTPVLPSDFDGYYDADEELVTIAKFIKDNTFHNENVEPDRIKFLYSTKNPKKEGGRFVLGTLTKRADIEKMVNEVYAEEQRTAFLDGLDNFIAECIHSTGKSFSNLSEDEQLEYASEMNRESIINEQTVRPQFFLQFKELTMVGYFTSEVGATQVLRYEPVPGFYDGCIPFEEVGRTWAT
jgi:hypothetical protein